MCTVVYTHKVNMYLLRTKLNKNTFIVKWLCSAVQQPLPSGWKPPEDKPTKAVPFLVRRTNSNNLPVYLDYRNGRSRILTIIRKIEGNPMVLETMLREHLDIPNVLSRVDELTGQIILKGDYRHKTKMFLRSLGF